MAELSIQDKKKPLNNFLSLPAAIGRKQKNTLVLKK